MNIRELTGETLPIQQQGAMLVNYRDRTVSATDQIRALESEVLARASTITEVSNREQNDKACEAQASLARYIRAVLAAEKAAKDPLNDLRGKILALSKELIAAADREGNRLGKLTSDFQIAEQNRAAASRRLQDQQATALEKEMDLRLSHAKTVDEQDSIKDEYRQQLADAAKPVEAARAQGQVVTQQWDVIVQDVHMLYRVHPNCVKLTPLVSEIKALLDMGIVVKGVKADKVTKAGVRLGREQPAITI